MARWEPGAVERLRSATLELYATKGFEETTVAEIAQAAGLTERTFFRYFADKREVIFGGSELLEQEFVNGVTAAPEDAAPLQIVIAAITGAADFFPDDRRSSSRQRNVIIAANSQLQERELRKMSSLAAAIAASLRGRGIPEPAATLCAECGVTVFRMSFAEWIADGAERSLVDIERDLFAELSAIAATTQTADHRPPTT
jgi:AcrR family transcriptional regulator